jgi:hypothetical protein
MNRGAASVMLPVMPRKKNRMPLAKPMAMAVAMKAPAVHPMMLNIRFTA